MTIDVECTLRVLAVDGVEVEYKVGMSRPVLVVRDANTGAYQRVELEFNGQRIEVLASDLEAAIKNARNNGHY